MVTVRSIITEALNRSNLVSRRQTPPADMVETGLRLLKGLAAKYSNDNLLQFLVCDCEHELDRREFVLGEIDLDDPSQYNTVDISAKLIQKVNKVYWRPKDTQALGSYVELNYAAPSDFDAYPDGCAVYTAQPINDLQILLKTKLLPDAGTAIKVSYNRKWSFELDSELRIPEQYVELFTVALTHKLALAFPRLSSEQVNLIKADLDEMIKNVKTATRAVKYISRRPAGPCISRAAFISGSMFFGD